MEAPEEKKAREMIAKAEKALDSWSFFGSSSGKFDDACEALSKAGNLFKIAKNWDEAASCYVRCADLKKKTEHQFEAASFHVLAAEMVAKTDTAKAVAQYREAIMLYSEIGRFGTAAKHAETIADLYEKDGNLTEAIKFYEQAAEYFLGEKSSARAGKCLEKVALHSAILGDFDKAMKGFEKLGIDSLESNLLKFNAKKHFLHASMCALAKGDTVAAENAIARYSELDYTFSDSAECKLIKSLTEACTEFNVDKFADVLFAYDQIRKLDPWETSIFLKIKNNISEPAGTPADENKDLL